MDTNGLALTLTTIARARGIVGTWDISGVAENSHPAAMRRVLIGLAEDASHAVAQRCPDEATSITMCRELASHFPGDSEGIREAANRVEALTPSDVTELESANAQLTNYFASLVIADIGRKQVAVAISCAITAAKVLAVADYGSMEADGALEAMASTIGEFITGMAVRSDT